MVSINVNIIKTLNLTNLILKLENHLQINANTKEFKIFIETERIHKNKIERIF